MTVTDNVFSALTALLEPVAPTTVGFYQLPRRQAATPNITIQPHEVAGTKSIGTLNIFIVLTISATAENSAETLVNLARDISQLLSVPARTNTNLNGLVTDILELETAKIIAPEPQQTHAQVLLNYSIKYINK